MLAFLMSGFHTEHEAYESIKGTHNESGIQEEGDECCGERSILCPHHQTLPSLHLAYIHHWSHLLENKNTKLLKFKESTILRACAQAYNSKGMVP